jgi:hypothetical protein
MATNREKLASGVKYLAFAFPFAVAGPVLLTAGFAREGIHLFTVLGAIGMITAILLGGLGIRTLVRGFFGD